MAQSFADETMQNPARIRAIYQELRAAGIDAPAKDVLRLANIILQANIANDDEVEEFGRVVDSRSFSLLPVDIAMRDGGWRIWEHELKRVAGDDLDPAVAHAVRQRISKLLGPEWHQVLQPA